MFYRRMPFGDGLLLYPCKMIHTFGMKFTLDVVYLNRRGKVVAIQNNMAVNRIGPFIRDAYYVLELPTGCIVNQEIQPGDQFWW
jgi:uncharacterized membrane protein (UPF0127 family)